MKSLTNLITKVLIILISMIGIVSCGENPEELFQKAEDCKTQGNNVEAVKYYQLAAEKGHVVSQMYIGVMYLAGVGVERNTEKALEWLKIAAENGNAQAQYTLGMMYNSKDMGVVQNYYEAAKWYKLSAEQGFDLAQYQLGLFYRFGIGVKEDESEAIRLVTLAAEQGNKDAIKTLESWTINEQYNITRYMEKSLFKNSRRY